MYTQATNSVLQLVGGVSTDIFILLAVVLILIAIGLSKGKDMLIVFILAIYPSALITAHFPFYDYASYITARMSVPMIELLLFTVIVFAGVAIFSSYVDTGYQQHTFWRHVEVVALAFASVILTMSVFYNIIEFQYLYDFSPTIDTLFASEKSFFYWLLAPFIIIPSFVRP